MTARKHERVGVCLDASIEATQSDAIHCLRALGAQTPVPQSLQLFDMFLEDVGAPLGHLDHADTIQSSGACIRAS